MPSEFDLIRRHFTRPTRHTDLAGGDDAALLSPTAGQQLVVSTDMLVEGTHFFPGTDATDLGWKTLAVNVSDLAAMGAQPRWAVLALALPAADDTWLGAFADGFFACADAHGVDLAGGDTTRGPLTLTVTVFGEVPNGRAVTRAGARPGDDIWISGMPGRAALGLAHVRGDLTLPDTQRPACLAALHRPIPRVAAGLALRDIASAMLDVSDGLLGDLSHILAQSRVAAVIDEAALPLAALDYPGANADTLRRALLSGGDDYELLFCAPAAARPRIAALAPSLALPFTRIGRVVAPAEGLRLRDAAGQLNPPGTLGYDHFL